MASEIKVDTVSENTTNNGITVDTFKLKDGITINSATIAGTQTIASGNNGIEKRRKPYVPSFKRIPASIT